MKLYIWLSEHSIIGLLYKKNCRKTMKFYYLFINQYFCWLMKATRVKYSNSETPYHWLSLQILNLNFPEFCWMIFKLHIKQIPWNELLQKSTLTVCKELKDKNVSKRIYKIITYKKQTKRSGECKTSL